MMNLRGFYRSVELIQGWRGYLITHESYVIGLDAVPMVLVCSTSLSEVALALLYVVMSTS